MSNQSHAEHAAKCAICNACCVQYSCSRYKHAPICIPGCFCSNVRRSQCTHKVARCNTVPNLNIIAKLYTVTLKITVGINILHCVSAYHTVVFRILRLFYIIYATIFEFGTVHRCPLQQCYGVPEQPWGKSPHTLSAIKLPRLGRRTRSWRGCLACSRPLVR